MNLPFPNPYIPTTFADNASTYEKGREYRQMLQMQLLTAIQQRPGATFAGNFYEKV